MMAAAHNQRSPAEITLIALAFAFAAVLLIVPLAVIFAYALREGLGVYLANIAEPGTLHAIGLSAASGSAAGNC
jgi:sulfate/thiosulfate transport system permease protein